MQTPLRLGTNPDPRIVSSGSRLLRPPDGGAFPLLKVSCNQHLAAVPLDSASLDELVSNAVSLCGGIGNLVDPCIVDEKRAVIDDESFRTIYRLGYHDQEQPHYLVSRAEASRPITAPSHDTTTALPHPNALTAAGKRSFTSPDEAVGELVDNSLGATKVLLGLEPQIEVNLHEQGNFVTVGDNGCGMSFTKLKEFATYAASRESRGYEDPANTSSDGACISQNINKFGVGAKDAGFYLGTRITVVSKCSDGPDFQMLIMCEQEMLRKYDLDPNSGKYYEFPIVTLPPPCVLATVLKGFSRASHGQPSSPSLHSAVEEFSRASHGTLVIISGLRPLTVEWSSKMVSCKGSDTEMPQVGLALAENYHFYMHPNDFPDWMSREVTETPSRANIVLCWHQKRSQRRVALAGLLSRIKRCMQDAKSIFTFRIDFEASDSGSIHKGQAYVVFRFHPYESQGDDDPAGETNPELDGDSEPRLRVLWSGRGVPRSTASVLTWLLGAQKRTAVQQDKLPDAVMSRVSGHIFFPRNMPIANNKTMLQLSGGSNFEQWLSEQNMIGSNNTRQCSVKASVKKWLAEAHSEHDQEILFSEPFGPEAEQRFKCVVYGTEQQQSKVKKGDKFRLTTNKSLIGEVVHFEKGRDIPHMFFQEFPEELHPKPTKIAMARLLKGGKFKILTSAEWTEESERAVKRLPHSVQVEPRITQYEAGDVIPALVVRVLDGNNEDMLQLKHRKLCMKVYKKYEGWELVGSHDLSWIESSRGFVAKNVKLQEAVEHKYEFDVENGGPQFRAGPQCHQLSVTPAEVSECVLRIDSDLCVWNTGVRLGDVLPTVEMLLFDKFGNHRDAERWLNVTAQSNHRCVRVILQTDQFCTRRGDVSLMIEGIKLEYFGPADVPIPTDVQITFNVSSGTQSVKCYCDVSSDGSKVYALDSGSMPGTFNVRVLPGLPHKVVLESDSVGSVIASQELPGITIGLRDSNGLPTYPRSSEEWSIEGTSPHISRSRKIVMQAGASSLTIDKLKLIEKDVDTPTDAALFFKLGSIPTAVPSLQVPFQIRPTGHPNVLRLNGTDCSIGPRQLDAGSSIDNLQVTLHRVTQTEDEQLHLFDFKLINIAITGQYWEGNVEQDDHGSPTGNLPRLRAPTNTSRALKHKVTVRCKSNTTGKELTLHLPFEVQSVAGSAHQLLIINQGVRSNNFEVQVGAQEQLSQMSVQAADIHGNVVDSTNKQLQVSLSDYPGLVATGCNELSSYGFFPHAHLIAHLGPKGSDSMQIIFSCSGLLPVTVDVTMVPGAPQKMQIQLGNLIPPLKCKATVEGLKVVLLDQVGNITRDAQADAELVVASSSGSVVVAQGQIAHGGWLVTPWQLHNQPGETIQIHAQSAGGASKIQPSEACPMKLTSVNQVIALEIDQPPTLELIAGACAPTFEGSFSMDDQSYPSKPWDADLSQAIQVINSSGIAYTVKSIQNRAFRCSPSDPTAVMSTSGQHSFVVQYTELRPMKDLLDSNERQVRAAPITFRVSSGSATRIAVVDPPEISVAYDDVGTHPQMFSGLHCQIQDSFRNHVPTHNTTIACNVTVVDGSSASSVAPIVRLSGNAVINGEAHLSALVQHNTGLAGLYTLEITAPGLQPWSLEFTIVTDVRRKQELDTQHRRILHLEQHLSPFKSNRDETQQAMRDARTQLEAKLTEAALSASTPEVEITTQISHTESNLETILLTPLREAVRATNMPGQLVDLAYVDDPAKAQLVSWFLRRRLGSVLCNSNVELAALLAAGVAGFSSDMISETHEQLEIPLDVPGVPSVELLWSLLTFRDDAAAQLFASILGNSVVLDTLDAAIRYHTQMVLQGKSCKILIEDFASGCMCVEKDGFVDPEEHCSTPEYVLGSVPHQLRTDVQQLNEHLSVLQGLREHFLQCGRAEAAFETADNAFQQEDGKMQELQNLKKSFSNLKRARDPRGNDSR